MEKARVRFSAADFFFFQWKHFQVQVFQHQFENFLSLLKIAATVYERETCVVESTFFNDINDITFGQPKFECYLSSGQVK